MSAEIHLLDVGFTNSLVIKGEGAVTVYPSHGKPFPADVMREALNES